MWLWGLNGPEKKNNLMSWGYLKCIFYSLLKRGFNIVKSKFQSAQELFRFVRKVGRWNFLSNSSNIMFLVSPNITKTKVQLEMPKLQNILRI